MGASPRSRIKAAKQTKSNTPPPKKTKSPSLTSHKTFNAKASFSSKPGPNTFCGRQNGDLIAGDLSGDAIAAAGDGGKGRGDGAGNVGRDPNGDGGASGDPSAAADAADPAKGRGDGAKVGRDPNGDGDASGDPSAANGDGGGDGGGSWPAALRRAQSPRQVGM